MLTAQAIEELVRRSQPRGRLGSMRLPLYVVSGVAIGVLLASPGLLGLPSWCSNLAPLVLVLWVVGLGRWELRRQIRQARRWTRAHEAVLQEQWPAACDALTDLLSKPVDNPGLRAQGLLGLAAVTDHCEDYRSSQVIYELLVEDPTTQPIQRHTAAVGLAAAMLRNDELTDAVALIDRLSRSAREAPKPWRAQVELLCLFREAVMGQYDDILATSQERAELFRDGLSARSGYGYALLALGHHRRGLSEQAERFWQDATLLIPADKLRRRFPMLSELDRAYPSCETPL